MNIKQQIITAIRDVSLRMKMLRATCDDQAKLIVKQWQEIEYLNQDKKTLQAMNRDLQQRINRLTTPRAVDTPRNVG